MVTDPQFVRDALLMRNYFPRQKEDLFEIPPVFTSELLTPQVAEKLVERGDRRNAYDVVSYRSTRFNGVSRTCNIPHPAGYADLVTCIYDNWSKLRPLIESSRSIVSPRNHEDGRLITMDYESSSVQASRHLEMGFGKSYVVHADIASCFPSTYSHAIAWAAAGKDTAKKNTRGSTWYNKLDQRSRAINRNESNGIPIGPATSNVLLELILAHVDANLAKDFPNFVRYIDDYLAFTRSDEEAHDFVTALQRELAHFSFELSFAKTRTRPLPSETAPAWVSELVNLLPRGEAIKPGTVHAYMNTVQRLATENPDGSVVKFGVKSILQQDLQVDSLVALANHTISLAYHHPIVLPYFYRILEKQSVVASSFLHTTQVMAIIEVCAKRRRSDGMAWGLYVLYKMNRVPPAPLVESVIATEDCFALATLLLFDHAGIDRKIVEFARTLGTEPFERDRYWLLLYELAIRKKLSNEYTRCHSFRILREEGVAFLDPSR